MRPARLAAQERQHREHRQHRKILEQQNAESRAPVLGLQLLALGEHLQHERRRGERQAEADDRRRDGRLAPGPGRHPSSSEHESTCAAPSPNTVRRITHSRVGCSSSPMMKSSSTMPNSDTCMMRWTSPMRLSPQGPITSPAAT